MTQCVLPATLLLALCAAGQRLEIGQAAGYSALIAQPGGRWFARVLPKQPEVPVRIEWRGERTIEVGACVLEIGARGLEVRECR